MRNRFLESQLLNGLSLICYNELWVHRVSYLGPWQILINITRLHAADLQLRYAHAQAHTYSTVQCFLLPRTLNQQVEMRRQVEICTRETGIYALYETLPIKRSCCISIHEKKRMKRIRALTQSRAMRKESFSRSAMEEKLVGIFYVINNSYRMRSSKMIWIQMVVYEINRT